MIKIKHNILEPKQTVCTFTLQNMSALGFRVCVKELYETRYDPVSVSYVVLTGQYILTLTEK